jgi:hypothetical protein
MNLKEIRRVGLDEIAWFRIGRFERSREDENGPYSSVKWDRFLDYLVNCQLFKKESTPRSWSLDWYGFCALAFSCLCKNLKTDTYNAQQ